MLENIRLGAYFKWQNAGSPPGDGVSFWLQAEREYWQRSTDKLGQAVYWIVQMPYYEFHEEWRDWCKLVFNFFTNDLLPKLDQANCTIGDVVEYLPWLKDEITALLFLRHKGVLSAKNVKDLFPLCWDGVDVLTAIVNLDIFNVAQEDVVAATVAKHLAASPKVVEDYKKGKMQALNSLIGPVLRELGGKADATRVRAALEEQAAKL